MNARIYRNYLLILLMMILTFNYIDRIAIGIMLQDIKSDLALSDTELGFLTGIAFAAFYAVLGIPMARWADRGNRVTIIWLTAAIWSVMVALCGRAASFAQLLLVRVGVAVGEAGCIPPAHSLIADYFTRAERPRAVGIYMLGNSLCVVIGYFGAGWLNQYFGWRQTFVLIGVPGLLLAAIAFFTLREPRLEKRKRGAAIAADTHPSLKEVFSTLWSNVTFRHLVISCSVISFFGTGIVNWQPAFFMRSFGLKSGELGTWLAVISGGGGMLGTYLGGVIASRRAANNESLQLKAVAIAYLGFGIIYAVLYLSHNLYVAFALMGVSVVGGCLSNGPLFATTQTLVPGRMRATAIAALYLVANLIGMGLGPLFVGAMSDLFHSWAGAESLRYALLALCPGYAWGAWHAWQASRTVERDLAEAIAGDVEGHTAEFAVPDLSAA